MARATRTPSIECLGHLPPRDAWKRLDSDNPKKFLAPVDDRGFVLPDATVEMALEYFDDDYAWPVEWSKNAPHILRPDDHHFQWVASNYDPSRYGTRRNQVAKIFRNLPDRRGILPRQFHNVIHALTIPPNIPRLRDMERYIRSWQIAQQLFRSADLALMAERQFMLADKIAVLESYERRYDLFAGQLALQLETIKDTDVLENIGIEWFDSHDVSAVHQRLGSCALITIPNYTNAYFSYFSEELDINDEANALSIEGSAA